MDQEYSSQGAFQRDRNSLNGVKMQTLPTESDVLKSAPNLQTSSQQGEEDEYYKKAPSSFEIDDDFRFKRHRGKASNQLGERLDNLQELQNAKWVENFNSSLNQMGHLQSPQRIPMSHMQQIPNSQYVPYMYYYPMPAPIVSLPPTSPQRSGENFPSQNGGIYGNSSIQPFYPHFGSLHNGQLMPPPTLYPPPHYSTHNNTRNQITREKKKHLMSQRGKRLSIISFKDDNDRTIISPHKDVPETDFYRHIANNSFGHDLQVRQLFNWCLVRSLKNLEQDTDREGISDVKNTDLNHKIIAFDILREFVQELRKGKVDLDWDSREISDQEQSIMEEDTELQDLFDDDTTIKKKRSKVKFQKLPNEKNFQNSQNIIMLKDKISNIRKEIDQWSTDLENMDINKDWDMQEYDSSMPLLELSNISSQDFKIKFTQKMDSFQTTSHLINSHCKLLSKNIDMKLNKLSKCVVTQDRLNDNKYDTRRLLKGLSKTLTE